MMSYFAMPGIPQQRWTKGYKVAGLSIKHGQFLDTICAYFNISQEDLRTKSNTHVAVYHRSVFSYFLSQRKDIQQTEIAKFLHCDRSAIQYHKRLVEGQLTSRFDNEYKVDIPMLATILSNTTNK